MSYHTMSYNIIKLRTTITREFILMRMDSLTRAWLGDLDLYTMKQALWQGILWVQLYLRMKTFLLVPCWASNH